MNGTSRPGAPDRPAEPRLLPGRDFLADDERVLGDEILVTDRVATLLDAPRPQLEHTFLAANLLSLVLFRQGATERARELCRAEIGLAMSFAGTSRQADAAGLALQPQINLIRVDGHLRRLDAVRAGLTELERVADGERADFSDLRWDPALLGDDVARHRATRLLARNVLVTDTCKFLLKCGALELLLAEARRFQERWPKSVRGGLHHPAEAAWLLTPADQGVPAAAELSDSTLETRRLAFIRLLHLADHSAARGEQLRAARMVDRLQSSWACVEGPFASPGTLTRWRISLARTLLTLGRAEEGFEQSQQAYNQAVGDGDGVAVRSAGRLLAETGNPPAAVGTPRTDRGAARRRAASLADRMCEVLSSGRTTA